jgi:4-amino-4-deoxy-L-arabinose transferase-like glycosyltransferase
MTAARRHLPAVGVALLALAATITSLGHDFTYDDRYVILANDLVHHLRGLGALWGQTYWPEKFGSDGYRPVVMTLFTVQWVLGNGAAWVFHLGNILLAVAVALAVRWCAASVLPPRAAFVAGALFAVHPVHVEVTGNVVGQSELVVALCLALATGLYVRRRLLGGLPGRDAMVILLLFALALFTKEHAVVLPGILLAAELTVIRDGEWRTRMRHARPLGLALVAVCVAYLLARGLVQRNLAGFEPFPVFRFLRLGPVDRALTMMTEIPRIARLLLFPTHLSADYSPLDVVVARGFDAGQLPGIMIALGTPVLAAALRRRAPVISFGLLWLIVAYLPVSNLLVPAGFITAERTLFFPSIGVALIGAALAERLLATETAWIRRLAIGVVGVLLLLGVARSIDRQRVWKNNDVFVDALVRDAPLGYRAHFVRGRHLGLKGRLRDMELEYRRAIRLFPYDAAMTVTIADGYTRAGLCKPAIDLFEWTFAVEPATGEGRYQYVYCLAKLERWADVRREALAGLSLVAPRDSRLMRTAVQKADSALGSRPR